MAFWGSPVSTGLPSVDYFLSAEDFFFPPPNDTFSEQPVILDGVGAYLFPPNVAAGHTAGDMRGSPANRRALLVRLGIPPDGPVLFCAQVSVCPSQRCVLYCG